MTDPTLAFLLGVLQGVLEWLPVSSEGNVTAVLTLLGRSADESVALSLFLHLGTGLAAAVYYRETFLDVLARLPDWRPGGAFDDGQATLSFLGVATLVSGVVGVGAYLTIDAVVDALTGGAFVAVIGLLLVATGLLQRVAERGLAGRRVGATAGDAVLVGALQGLAILPGVSRSGVTVSALLLRGHDGPESVRLSFLLSVPAALGGAAIAVLDAGGLPAIDPVPAGVALAAAAVVGYLTVDALTSLVDRVAFWLVCVGLGGLAVLGGALVAL